MAARLKEKQRPGKGCHQPSGHLQQSRSGAQTACPEISMAEIRAHRQSPATLL
ncbi:hypothetical protein [Bosea sp. (in: a-proteobacteria)]|uniref:hypothetical protein n=1 Tax=Bosea sp. (in: a-proteobacteria) TaxID=1871050 RepID=UPI0026267284|nr:hypothetical protein [Bosea sp. (in: a-proteobacteria)]MCO5091665.1 hypothetical protein [Bosea sp. (in: a-proteobacteria)]